MEVGKSSQHTEGKPSMVPWPDVPDSRSRIRCGFTEIIGPVAADRQGGVATQGPHPYSHVAVGVEAANRPVIDQRLTRSCPSTVTVQSPLSLSLGGCPTSKVGMLRGSPLYAQPFGSRRFTGAGSSHGKPST